MVEKLFNFEIFGIVPEHSNSRVEIVNFKNEWKTAAWQYCLFIRNQGCQIQAGGVKLNAIAFTLIFCFTWGFD